MDGPYRSDSPSTRLLFDAVLDVLAERGFSGLTVLAIQSHAGAAGRALDESVDVEEVVVAALETVQLWRTPAPTGSLRGDLHALLQGWRNPRTRDDMAVAAVLSEAEWRPRLGEAVSVAVDRPLAQAIGNILSRADELHDSEGAAQTLSWLLRGLLLERLRHGARSVVDLERLVDFLLAGLAGQFAGDVPGSRDGFQGLPGRDGTRRP